MSRHWEAPFFAAAAKVVDAIPQWENPKDLGGLQEALLLLIQWAGGESWVRARPGLLEPPEQLLHAAGFRSHLDPKVPVQYKAETLWFSTDNAWALMHAGDPTNVPCA